MKDIGQMYNNYYKWQSYNEELKSYDFGPLLLLNAAPSFLLS